MSYGRQLRGKLCIGLKHEELKTLKKKKKMTITIPYQSLRGVLVLGGWLCVYGYVRLHDL